MLNKKLNIKHCSLKYVIFLAILIIFPYHIIFNTVNSNMLDNLDSNNKEGNLTQPKTNYISHAPIYIDGNNDFQNQANSEGWSGDGTSANPYTIDGYIISSSGGDLIDIRNTNVHFIISNNYLDGIVNGPNTEGISLFNVQHGIISKNTIEYCAYGIVAGGTTSSYILIENNNLRYNFYELIPGYKQGGGIKSLASNSIIKNNNIEYNYYGINMGGQYNVISSNYINTNEHVSIHCYEDYNSILSNAIINSGDHGLYLLGADHITLQSNNFIQNTPIGAFIDSPQYLEMHWNNFILNTQRQSVIFGWDTGSNYDYNYFNDWTGSPSYYSLDLYYTTDYCDWHPLSSQHTILTPTVISPNGGGIYTGETTIQWSGVSDSHGHLVTYSIDYSADNGVTWTSLITDITSTNFVWDTSTSLDSNNSLIRVVANCDKGLISQDVSDSTFTVHNNLPEPTILQPNGGEIIDGIYTIQWEPIIDPFGHSITYKVFYSDNDGSTWNSLISDLTEISFDWDTTTLPDGNYLIKVEATCSEGAKGIDISDNPFSIFHHILAPPSLIYPNGGEILTGIELLQWNAAIDSYGHDITYTLYYSLDGGLIWVPFASGITETSFQWDTRSLIESTTYIVKVVATCSEMLFAEDQSDGFFTIHNDISVPTVLFPNGGEILQGEVIIQWTEAIDSMGHGIYYNLLCSLDGGINWDPIISALTSTSYNWNTLTVADSNNALIKVVANCSEGAVSEDISDNPFTIRNHILTAPILNSPNGGEVIHGTYYISWTEASDSLGHPIVYDLYYSNNSGSDWTLLIDNLDALSWAWDTRLVPDGENYLIKVVAKCSHGLNGEDISDSVFEIKNHFFTTDLVIYTPSDNEIITGNYQIYWSYVMDFLGHSITYDVYYSDDGGLNWNALITSISYCYYYWATWDYGDGSNYFIKVVATCTEGLSTEAVKESLILDNTNPSGSIIINEGAEYTNTTSVVLTIEGYDANGVMEMRFSNDGVSWTSWESYSISKTYSLQSGDGEKTVYVQFKDGAGLISDPTVINDSIILDTISPFGSIQINNDETFTTSTSVTLTMYGYDENGITAMRFGYDGVSWTSWEPFNISKIFILPNGDGEKTVYIQFKDVVGLISNDIISDSIILDTTTPTGSILINNGDEYTSTTYNTLTIDSYDANGVIEMRFSLDNIVWTEWEPYSSFKSIEAEGVNGIITVYIQFKDAAGLISDNIIFDEIILKTSETEDKNISGPTMIIVGLFIIIGVISLIYLKKRDVIFKS